MMQINLRSTSNHSTLYQITPSKASAQWFCSLGCRGSLVLASPGRGTFCFLFRLVLWFFSLVITEGKVLLSGDGLIRTFNSLVWGFPPPLPFFFLFLPLVLKLVCHVCALLMVPCWPEVPNGAAHVGTSSKHVLHVETL